MRDIVCTALHLLPQAVGNLDALLSAALGVALEVVQ